MPSGTTFEGGAGYARDARSELFLLALSNMVGENTFYETASTRDDRYERLVREVAGQDPEWVARFLRWLRSEANMRSAPLVGAAVFAHERLRRGEPGMSRQVVDSVLLRADEPGEVLAYWISAFGRTVPKPDGGIADAAVRLYDERAVVKWDSAARAFRFADVLELTHPKPRSDRQSALFAHLLDRRFHPRSDIGAVLKGAGLTWEAVAGWLQGPMDAAAWEAVIPAMGYTALLRNLRNFDEAGVSDEVAQRVAARIADPEQVKRSRQLPMRFLSAHRAAPGPRWAEALERAITASLANVPALDGRTLVLVDTSASMQTPFSRDGTLMRWDAAAVFGLALAARCERADLVSFSSAWRGRATKVFRPRSGESLLRAVRRWHDGGFFLGGGTDTEGALRKHFRRGHERVVILTDEQAGHGDVGAVLPPDVALYTWNLAGYPFGHAPSGGRNRHTSGGLGDRSFALIPLLESGQDARWPF